MPLSMEPLAGFLFQLATPMSGTGRELLAAADGDPPIGNNPEYIRRAATPAAAGIALGAIVLLSYLLFFIISACCKCCSEKRGCCQRAQPTPYCARLPYIIIVALCAVIGLVGGAIVLKGAPSFATATRTLVTDQVDSILDELRKLIDLAQQAAEAAGEEPSTGDLNTLLESADELREGPVEQVVVGVTKYTGLAETIGLSVGAGLLGLALVGLVGAALLQNWIQVIFLLLGFLVTWAAWILFGVFTSIRVIVGDFCDNMQDTLQGKEGAQQFLECPDLSAAQASIQQVFSDINAAVVEANGAIANANDASADAYDALQVQCGEFNSNAAAGEAPTLRDILCTGGESAALLSAAYQCITIENDSSLDLFASKQDASSSSCTWFTNNYPTSTVDFASDGATTTPALINCYNTATETLQQKSDFYKMPEAAAAAPEGALLSDSDFVRFTLGMFLAEGCSADETDGTVSVRQTAAPIVQPLCEPFTFVPENETYVSKPPSVCDEETPPKVPISEVDVRYDGFVCSEDSAVYVAANETQSRRNCMAAGNPLLESDFEVISSQAAAIEIFQQMVPLIERQARCIPLLELSQGIVDKNCPEMAETTRTCAIGFALSAAGLTLVAFLICACWRKLVKVSAQAQVMPDGSYGDDSGSLVLKKKVLQYDSSGRTIA